MRMVEVFTTNVHEAAHAKALMITLMDIFPDCQFNFDLEDCDKILRVEGDKIDSHKIIWLLNSRNFRCEILN